VILLIQIQVQEKGVKQACFFSGNSSGYPQPGGLLGPSDLFIIGGSVYARLNLTLPGVLNATLNSNPTGHL